MSILSVTKQFKYSVRWLSSFLMEGIEKPGLPFIGDTCV